MSEAVAKFRTKQGVVVRTSPKIAASAGFVPVGAAVAEAEVEIVPTGGDQAQEPETAGASEQAQEPAAKGSKALKKPKGK